MGGSATLRPEGGGPFFFFFFSIFVFNFLILKDFFFLHCATGQHLREYTWQSVKSWTEKLTKVSYLSFPKIQVPSTMGIKTEVPKNKVLKPQVPKMSLTQK
jgi:hypothetical protein